MRRPCWVSPTRRGISARDSCGAVIRCIESRSALHTGRLCPTRSRAGLGSSPCIHRFVIACIRHQRSKSSLCSRDRLGPTSLANLGTILARRRLRRRWRPWNQSLFSSGRNIEHPSLGLYLVAGRPQASENSSSRRRRPLYCSATCRGSSLNQVVT